MKMPSPFHHPSSSNGLSWQKKNESCWCSFKHFREKGHVRSCDQWWSGVPKWCLKGLVHPSLPSIRFYFTRLANIPKSWDTRYLSHVKRDLFGSYSWKLAPGNSMHNHNHSCFQGMARTIKNHSTWVFCKWPSTKTSLENNPSLNKPHFYTFLPWGLMISRFSAVNEIDTYQCREGKYSWGEF